MADQHETSRTAHQAALPVRGAAHPPRMSQADTDRQETAEQTLARVREALDGYTPYPVYDETDDIAEMDRRDEELHDHLLDAEERLEVILSVLGLRRPAPHIYRAMSTFDESNVRRQPEGVSAGGQFATKPKGETDVTLSGYDATARAADAKLDLPDGHEVAIRNTLSDHPKWLHGTVTRDAPVSMGQLGVLVYEGDEEATFIVDAGEVLPFVEPAEYDGDDVDTMADAFGWSPDDWGYYYDGRAEREQTGAYRNGFEDGQAAAAARTTTASAAAKFRELATKMRSEHVQTWKSTSDEVWGRPGVCAADGAPWPCDVDQLLDAADAAGVHERSADEGR